MVWKNQEHWQFYAKQNLEFWTRKIFRKSIINLQNYEVFQKVYSKFKIQQLLNYTKNKKWKMLRLIRKFVNLVCSNFQDNQTLANRWHCTVSIHNNAQADLKLWFECNFHFASCLALERRGKKVIFWNFNVRLNINADCDAPSIA